ncbi:hypothetical protein [Microcystis sp. BLCC-F209]
MRCHRFLRGTILGNFLGVGDFSYQLSVISYQLSVISYQLSVYCLLFTAH